MDPSTPTAQDVQTQTQPIQPVTTAQPSAPAQQPVQPVQPAHPTPISVPGSIEEGGAVMQENPDATEDDEEELHVAPQETKNQAVGQQGMTADAQEELLVTPSVLEFEASPEVENIIEKTPSAESALSEEVKKAGVKLTQSGPGIIDPSQTTFSPAKIPVSFDEAVVEEKQTELHESKHWLMGKIVYLWRKLNPNITLKKQPVKKAIQAQTLAKPVQSAQTKQPEPEKVG